MNAETTVFLVLAAALLGILLWLLRPQEASRSTRASSSQLKVEDLFPLHCRHFPQLQQALSSSDKEYLKGRASEHLQRQVRVERRKVARRFLAGLGEDFNRLVRLARTVATLAPRVNPAQEREILWLSLRFRALYMLVSLRLAVGWNSLAELTRLADLIARLAAEIESGMLLLGDTSIARLRAGFSE